MKKELLNVLFEYSKVMKSKDSMADKLAKVKELSFLLHNELYLDFMNEVGTQVIEDYKLFTQMGNNIINKSSSNDISIIEESGTLMFCYKNKKKPVLSAQDIAKGFIDSDDQEILLLFSIFISNESDSFRFNLLS